MDKKEILKTKTLPQLLKILRMASKVGDEGACDEIVDVLTSRGNKKAPIVDVTPVIVDTDPKTTVFDIKVGGESGIWKEVVNTRREAEFFLRGMKAMNAYSGFIDFEVLPVPDSTSS